MPKAKKGKGGSSTSRSSLVKDFDKQKTKLGKGKKAVASNATNTSFKTKSIALTQQSITKDRSAAPTSKRNLTVEELIGQTRHYSASVRRDALVGLKEIYQSHNSLIVRHLGLVVPNVFRLTSDEDAGVRTSLYSFMTFYLASIPTGALRPYTSTFLLYTTSAMSHIYPDIRLDAVRILDLLYPAIGAQVTVGWRNSISTTASSKAAPHSSSGEATQEHGERVLRCYLSLLGLSTGNNSLLSASPSFVVSSDLSPGARLLILRSMQSFFRQSNLERATSSDHSQIQLDQSLTCPTWFFDPYFTSLPELDAFKLSLSTSTVGKESIDVFASDDTCLAMSNLESIMGRGWNSVHIAEGLDSIVQATESFLDEDKSKKDDDASSRCQLFQILSPLLLSIFFDAAPTAFAPANLSSSTKQPLTTSAHLVCTVASLTLALWRGTTKADSGSRDCLGKLLSHMSLYFPFGANWQGGGGSEMLELNLSFCELVGLFAMTQGKLKGKEEAQINQISDFVVDLLTEGDRQDRIKQSLLRGKTFVDLLPTIWLLLNGKGSGNSKVIIDALLVHWNSLKAHDPTKRIATEFMGRLWLLPLQRSYHGHFTIRPASPHRICLMKWLTECLPRYLWELHARDTEASAMVLELLRRVVCQTDGLILTDRELEWLSRPLTPFFQVQHAVKGIIPGPYTRLPHPVQRIARGLLATLHSSDSNLQHAAMAVGASTPTLA